MVTANEHHWIICDYINVQPKPVEYEYDVRMDLKGLNAAEFKKALEKLGESRYQIVSAPDVTSSGGEFGYIGPVVCCRPKI